MRDFKLCSVDDIEESPTIELTAGTGRARCRICGERIAKSVECWDFFASFTDGGYTAWTSMPCKAHRTCVPVLQHVDVRGLCR